MRALRLDLTVKSEVGVQLLVKVMVVAGAALLSHCDSLVKKINWYILPMALVIFQKASLVFLKVF